MSKLNKNINIKEKNNTTKILFFHKEIIKLNENLISEQAEKEYWKIKYQLAEFEKKLLNENHPQNIETIENKINKTVSILTKQYKETVNQLTLYKLTQLTQQFEEELINRNNENLHLINQIKQLTNDNQNLLNNIENLNNQISDLQSKEDEYLANISFLKQRNNISSLGNDRKELQKQFTKALQEYEKLQNKYKTAKTNNAILQKQNMELEEKIKNLTNQTWHLHDIIKQNDINHANVTAELIDKYNQIETERDNLADEIEALDNIISGLIEENENLKTENYELMENDFTQPESAGTSLKNNEIDEIETTGVLVEENENLVEENENLLEEMKILYSIVDEYEKENEKLLELLELLEENSIEMEKRIQDSSQNQPNSTQINANEKKYNKLIKEKEELFEDKKSLLSNILKLNQEIQQLTIQKKEIIKLNENLQNQNNEQQEKINVLQEENKVLNSEIDSLNNKINQLNERSQNFKNLKLDELSTTAQGEIKELLDLINNQQDIKELKQHIYFYEDQNFVSSNDLTMKNLKITSDLLEKTNNKNLQLQKEIENLQQSYAQQLEDINQLKTNIKNISSKSEDLQNINLNLSNKLETAYKDLQNIKNHKQDILKYLVDLDMRMEVTEDEINEGFDYIDYIEKQLNLFKNQLNNPLNNDEKQKIISALNDKISSLEEHIIIMEIKNSSLKQIAEHLNEIANNIEMMGLIKASEDIRKITKKLNA